MAAFPIWAAVRTIKSKLGTWVGFERYSELDPTITRQQWATAIGQARAALANRVGELTRPVNRRPVRGTPEVTPYTAPRAKGFMQYVDVYVINREGGPPEARPWAVRVDNLRSRQAIINEAWARYEAATLPEGTFEGETVVGVAYAGTVEFVQEEQG